MYTVKIIQLQSSGWGLGSAHWPCPFSALILASLPSFGSPSYFQPQSAPTFSTPELPHYWSLIATHCPVHSQQDDY